MGSSLYDVYMNGWNAGNGVSLAFSLVEVAFSGLGLTGEGLRTIEDARYIDL